MKDFLAMTNGFMHELEQPESLLHWDFCWFFILSCGYLWRPSLNRSVELCRAHQYHVRQHELSYLPAYMILPKFFLSCSFSLWNYRAANMLTVSSDPILEFSVTE
jgi:hypothetical protein